MNSNLITGNSTFTYTSPDILHKNELEVLNVFLSGVSKLEKSIATNYMNLCNTMDPELAWEISYSLAINETCGGNPYSEMRLLPDCSGSQRITTSGDIYNQSLKIVDNLEIQLAKEQLTQINEYVNNGEEATKISDILNTWEENWLTPIQDVKVFSMGPSGKINVDQDVDDWLGDISLAQEPDEPADPDNSRIWVSQIVTSLTLFTFTPDLSITSLIDSILLSSEDIFKDSKLGGEAILSYRTVEFVTPPLTFSDSSQTAATLEYIKAFKSAYNCDPEQEIKSAKLA